jgi:hypothetical protein
MAGACFRLMCFLQTSELPCGSLAACRDMGSKRRVRYQREATGPYGLLRGFLLAQCEPPRRATGAAVAEVIRSLCSVGAFLSVPDAEVP